MSTPRVADHPVDPQFLQRWSPRAFTGEAIPEATLLSFFEAARWSPSAYNLQPWRFIYARRDTPAWQPVFDALVPFNQGWAAQASALVVVVSATQFVPAGKTEPQANASHAFDAGAAWLAFALQASLAGWHAHGIGGFDAEKVRQALGVPTDHAVQALIAVGRRGDKASLPEGLQAREAPNDRHPLAQLVAEGRFAFAGSAA